MFPLLIMDNKNIKNISHRKNIYNKKNQLSEGISLWYKKCKKQRIY